MKLNIVEFGSTVDLNIVIDEDGNEIRAIVSDANVIESRVYRKQFPSEKEERLSVNLNDPRSPDVAEVADVLEDRTAAIANIRQYVARS
jgi:hypothetical protein